MALSSTIHLSIAATSSGGTRQLMGTASTRGRPIFLALETFDMLTNWCQKWRTEARGGALASVLTANPDPEEIEMFAADPASSTPCVVAPLAVEASRLIRSMARYDGVSPELYDAALVRLSTLEVAACALVAVSTKGAFFQACLAYSCAEPLWSWVDDGSQRSAMPMRISIEGAALCLARGLATPDVADLADHYLPRSVAAQVAA